MTIEEERAVPPATVGQLYYQLTAELDVRFRRHVEDVGQKIIARLDNAESDRRDEVRAFDARLRTVELATPAHYFETVRKLDSGYSVLRGQIQALRWAGGAIGAVLTLAIAVLVLWFHRP